MAFSSPFFIFGFMVVFFPPYLLVPDWLRNSLILVASVLFYWAGAGAAVLILLISVVGNHAVALRLTKHHWLGRKYLLAIAVAVNLAALVYYKYAVFLLGFAVPLLGPVPDIVLPIGISFFTFQAISYLVDIYRGEVSPACSYSEFATYHMLFPQLIAGPIVRYVEVREALASRNVDLAQITQGAYRFCLGFGKKIIIADNVGRVTDQIMQLPSSELTASHAWLGIVCYTLQIYYDFSGYSDMAIGLGNLMGFRFPENFDQPYRSHSITEFWRRWHMTLSRWFRDYVYVPLGGNRRGPLRTYINLCIVFALCGFWHGASMNFLVWGLYHGFWMLIERILDRHLGWRPQGVIAVASTLIIVVIGWVFFRIEDLGRSVDYLQAMFLLSTAETSYLPVRHFLTPDILFYLILGYAFALLPANRLTDLRPERPGLLTGQLAVALVAFCGSVLQLAANSFNPFIYFRF
jgi:alginate O-acetyltransferase complex protein AlgI